MTQIPCYPDMAFSGSTGWDFIVAQVGEGVLPSHNRLFLPILTSPIWLASWRPNHFASLSLFFYVCYIFVHCSGSFCGWAIRWWDSGCLSLLMLHYVMEGGPPLCPLPVWIAWCDYFLKVVIFILLLTKVLIIESRRNFNEILGYIIWIIYHLQMVIILICSLPCKNHFKNMKSNKQSNYLIPHNNTSPFIFLNTSHYFFKPWNALTSYIDVDF